MNTFQLRLIKQALGDSDSFVQNLRGALELLQEENNLSPSQKKTVLGFFDQIDTIEFEDLQNEGFQDYTFRTLLVQNFRKYGKPHNCDYFALPFVKSDCDEGQTKNIVHVFLGDNGSGKSSFFDSMEYVSTGRISEAVYRRIDEKWFSSHLQTGDHSIIIKTPLCDISTASDEFKNNNIDVRRFFFSENSIMEMSEFQHTLRVEYGKGDASNWYDFFLYAIGLDSEFVDFISNQSGCNLFDRTCKALMYLKDILSRDAAFDERSLRNMLVDKATFLPSDAGTTLNAFCQQIENLGVSLKQDENLDLEKGLSNIDFPLGLEKYKETVSAFVDYIKQFNDIKTKISDKKENTNIETFQKQDQMFLKDNKSDANVSQGELRKELTELVSEFIPRFNILLSDDDAHFNLREIIQTNTDIRARKYAQSQPMIKIMSSENIEQLLRQLNEFREKVSQEIHKVVKEFIDEDFRRLVENMFDGTFMLAKEKFNFDILHIDEKQISISVNDIPVHKYFNTFRYRLFYLTIQAAINLVKMKRERFSFPMVLDDIFYANDYKNKRQLFKFFNLLEQNASKMLGNQPFQVIFFTHDEQLVSTLNRKNKNDEFCIWKFARIIEYEEFKDINLIKENEGYFKLSVPIYE